MGGPQFFLVTKKDPPRLPGRLQADKKIILGDGRV